MALLQPNNFAGYQVNDSNRKQLAWISAVKTVAAQLEGASGHKIPAPAIAKILGPIFRQNGDDAAATVAQAPKDPGTYLQQKAAIYGANFGRGVSIDGVSHRKPPGQKRRRRGGHGFAGTVASAAAAGSVAGVTPEHVAAAEEEAAGQDGSYYGGSRARRFW